MSRYSGIIALVGVFGTLCFQLGRSSAVGQTEAAGPIDSGLLRWQEVKVAASGQWGEFRSYFTGESAGTKDLLTGAALVKPGEEIHPPHKHQEEEFMYLAKGSGTWHLDGKEFPAKEGDVLYCKPFSVHGLKNTGTEPLTFFVVKWNGKNAGK